AQVRWWVDGVPQTGDPSSWRVQAGQGIVLGFDSDATYPGTPPQAASLVPTALTPATAQRPGRGSESAGGARFCPPGRPPRPGGGGGAPSARSAGAGPRPTPRHAGHKEARSATASVHGTTTSSQPGTCAPATAPRSSAMADQTTRPATIPSGTPMARMTTA